MSRVDKIKRTIGRIIVPKGSMCTRGFKLSRPACLGVGSPNLEAIHPWAYSWKVIDTKRIRIRIGIIICLDQIEALLLI